jgi:uncharacterized protein (DUF302 family)
MNKILVISMLWCLPASAAQPMPQIDRNSAVYMVPVEPGVSYDDVVTSLKVISEGMNFVNPANFPIGDHMKTRGQAPQGALEVRSFCNLSMGTEIFLDHPEFVVFAPCRVGLFHKQGQLYLAIDKAPVYLDADVKFSLTALTCAVNPEPTVFSPP